MSKDVLREIFSTLTQEQREELLAQLITDVGNLQTEDQKEEAPEPVRNSRQSSQDFTMHKNPEESKLGRRQAVKWQGNQFQDTGENKDESFDASKYERTPRRSPRNTKVTKVCAVCNKEFEISQALVYGKYLRCDRCTG